MVKLRQLLTILFIGTSISRVSLHAQGSLSAVRDVVLSTSGTPFSGTVTVTSSSHTAPNGSTVAAHTTVIRITNGLLVLLLTPTTTAPAGAQYTAVYLSNDGVTSWTETWRVPPSVTILNLSQIRVGSVPGGGTGNPGGGNPNPNPGTGGGTISLPIQITDVTNLSSTLASINSSVSSIGTSVTNLGANVSQTNSTVSNLSNQVNGIGSSVSGLSSTVTTLGGTVTGLSTSMTAANNGLAARPVKSANYVNGTLAMIDASGAISSVSGTASNCVRVDGSSGPCGSTTTTTTAVYVDGETPQGAQNSTNNVFTLSQTPSPSASLELFRNGVLQRSSSDYSLSGTTITYAGTATPQSGDVIQAYYRVTGMGATAVLTDAETPAGTMNGTNVTFTLAATPSPNLSLRLYRNGILLRNGTDYTVISATITLTQTLAPTSRDSLVAFYRR